MNDEKNNQLTFNANHIESFEINYDVASNCKLRSKLVHEKLLKSRTKDSIYSVILHISEKGVKVINPLDQVVISSHSIKRISYSACDRLNRLFALVVRSPGVTKCQLCYIFRMDTSEQADSVNRYFGSIFKQLHNQKKDKKRQQVLTTVDAAQSKVERYENVSDLLCSLELADRSDVIDSRLRQISTSKINELVSEKHNIRRLSLSIPTTDPDDVIMTEPLQPLHSSLEKQATAVTNNFTKPVVRRRKPENKGNRISAAIERWSFRGSRDMSSEFLKSGSPVVALKEQLEYEDLLSLDSSLGSGNHGQDPYPSACNVPHSQSSRKPVCRLPQNLAIISNDSQGHTNNNTHAPSNISSQLIRKNSAPICTPMDNSNDDDEQAPVPPVRIHSLRLTTACPTMTTTTTTMMNNIDRSLQTRSCGEGASQSIPGATDGNDDQDDDELSSITTPSSCDQMDSEDVNCGIYNEPPPRTMNCRNDPLTTSLHQNNYNYPPTKSMLSSQTPLSSANNCPASSASSIPIQYFRNCNKDEAMCYLLDKEIGGFLLRGSASHRGCMALSVKVADNLVSHYIIQQTVNGLQMKGLEKTWPNIQSLITHLSVIPEMLPCPIRITAPCPDYRRVSVPITYFTGDPVPSGNCRQKLPQSESADIEYQQRMSHFLRDISVSHEPAVSLQPVSLPTTHNNNNNTSTVIDQYQQLSDFSSIIASLDFV